ncbi:hypothetical protein [Clostridium chromiireducens]|uniref:hypothetical protein n=1 Tax=Clostridium chromiireducens TaxID=225345 RepID=UPI0015FD0115|nr:hypothetical protein [Clostridium chromiireducens]
MEIKEGITISGIDINGRKVEGKVISIMNAFRIATVQYVADRLDKTVISFDSINK